MATTISNSIDIPDNGKLLIGDSDDLQIYHDGSHSYIYDAGTGNLTLRSDSFRVNNTANTEQIIEANVDSSVKLFYNGSEKLETTSTGVNVTGSVTADGATVSAGASGGTPSSEAPLVIEGSSHTALNILAPDNKLASLYLGSASDTIGGSVNWKYDTKELVIGTLVTSGGEVVIKTGNNVEKMRIDSSGNMGIGTDDPSQLLEISGVTAPTIRLNDTTYNQYAEIATANAGSLILKADVGNGGTGSTYIGFEVDGANEAMRIDSAGNVGIGTDDPDATLEVEGSSNSTYLIAGGDDASNTRGLKFTSSASAAFNGAVHTLNAPSSQGEIVFSTYSLERMRIDSSGNVIVSGTSAGDATSVTLHNGGYVHAVSAHQMAGIFDREGSDGDIVIFRKDGSSVGSIGTYGGDLTIGTGDTGVRFIDSLDCLLPLNTSNNASRDAAIDLGHSETRFKDIYTSGGIYLGAASSVSPVGANKLDDYEEGTFTPTLSSGWSIGGSTWGRYTKIGNMVTIWVKAYDISTGTSYFLMDLPFATHAGEGRAQGSAMVNNLDVAAATYNIISYCSDNATQFSLYQCLDSGSWTIISEGNFSSGVTDVMVTHTYRAA